MSSFPLTNSYFSRWFKTTNLVISSSASNCQSTSRLNRWQNLRCLRRPLQRHRDAFFCRRDKFDPLLAYLLHIRYYHHPFHLGSKEDHPQTASFHPCSEWWWFREFRSSGPSLPMRRAMQLTPSSSMRSGGQVNVQSGGVSKCISNDLTHQSYLNFTLITIKIIKIII